MCRKVPAHLWLPFALTNRQEAMAGAIFASFLTWLVTRSGRSDSQRLLAGLGWQIGYCVYVECWLKPYWPRNYFSTAVVLQLHQHMDQGVTSLGCNCKQVVRWIHAVPGLLYRDGPSGCLARHTARKELLGLPPTWLLD